jgi:drug/metabolite transporter (DMT)-like permease
MKHRVVYLALILAMIFWSLSFVWYKLIYLYYKPFTTIFFRLILSTIFLFIIAVAFGKLQRIRRGDLKNLLIMAIMNPFLYFIGESLGIQYVSSSVSAVIISTIPLFTPIAAFYVFREKLSVLNVIGMLVSFLGIMVIIFYRNLTLNVEPRGLLLLSFAVITAVVYTIYLKKLAHTYNAWTIILFQNLVGAILFLPLFLVFDWGNFREVGFVFEPVMRIIELAIFASSLAFILYTFGIRHLGVSRTNFFTNLIPVSTAVFAYLILKEPLTIQKMVGILIVIIGLFLSQAGQRFFKR